MLEGLHEIILYVDDMARQIAFYRDTLGLEVVQPDDIEDPDDLHWVEFETGRCTLALHSGGDDQSRQRAPELVFEVGDVERAKERLEARGVEVGDIRSPAPGVRAAGARDPEGNRFSIESVDR